jgi:hypothetical protein
MQSSIPKISRQAAKEQRRPQREPIQQSFFEIFSLRSLRLSEKRFFSFRGTEDFSQSRKDAKETAKRTHPAILLSDLLSAFLAPLRETVPVHPSFPRRRAIISTVRDQLSVSAASCLRPVRVIE